MKFPSKYNTFILIILFFLSNNLFAQKAISVVHGGYTQYQIVTFEYKNKKLDSTSRQVIGEYRCNARGKKLVGRRSHSLYVPNYETSYRYDESGDTLLEYSVINLGPVDRRTHFYSYNKSGKICLETTLSQTGYVDTSDRQLQFIDKTIEYEYDGAGNLIYEISNNCNGVIYKKKFIYNTDNTLQDEQYFFGRDYVLSDTVKCSYGTRYFYDKNKNVIVKESYGGTVGKSRFIYDRIGNRVEELSGDKLPCSRIRYKYDSHRNIIESKQMNHKNVVENRVQYQYDTFGNLTEIMNYKGATTPVKKTIYLYSK